jgi:uncharacterized protein YjdB
MRERKAVSLFVAGTMLAGILFLACPGPQSGGGGSTPVGSVSVSPAAGSVVVGSTLQLTATVSPENATNKTLAWSSGNTAVATVSVSGLVSGHAPGTAAITVTTADGGKTATAQITVTAAPVGVTGVSINPAAAEVEAGNTLQLTATVSPADATNKAVTWSSGNTATATVSSAGLVSGIAPGMVTITAATADGGFTAVAQITVKAVGVQSISLDKTETYIAKGQTETVAYTISPANAANKEVSVGSSDSNIAAAEKIAEGQIKITAKNLTGTATITVTTQDGNKSASVTVNVSDPVPVQSITLSSVSLSLNKGATGTLTATLNPSNTADRVITWTSSDPAKAGVTGSGSSVTINALQKGSATITAAAGTGGVSAVCAVTVQVPLTGISLSSETLTLSSGGSSQTLTASPVPADADLGPVSWTSDNPLIASVSTGGVVSPQGLGVTKITASAGGKSASCTVTVNDDNIPVTGLDLNQPISLTLAKGAAETLTVSFTPNNATNKNAQWWTDNPAVATVVKTGDNTAKVTAVGGGSTIIGVWNGDGIYAQCSITVTSPVTGIVPNKTALLLLEGETERLTASIQPGDATNKAYTWSSDAPAVATVGADGTVTAVGAGTATITATSVEGGYTAPCAVTVIGQTSEGGIRVVFAGPVDENINLTQNGNLILSKSGGGILTLVPPEGFDYYTWFTPSGLRSYSAPSPKVFFADSPIFEIGDNEITLICEKNGIAYSKSLTVRVTY